MPHPAPTRRGPRHLPRTLPFFVLVLVFFSTGCSYVSLVEDTRTKEDLALIAGPVLDPEAVDDSDREASEILVLLFEETETGLVRRYVDRLDAVIDHYVFVLPAGVPHLVVAFRDSNGDRRYDPSEPLGLLGEGPRLVLEPGVRVGNQSIQLAASNRPPRGVDLDLAEVAIASLDSIALAAGETTTLDDPRFEPERGEDGMWKPFGSVREIGGGIYFLHDYDPAKVPVLFVHGIGGTPRDFDYLIEGLDRSRYQPWVFQYPSGMRLAEASRMLAGLMRSLHDEHGFETLLWTAHSMGGLVSRGALLQLAATEGGVGFVRLFATFSTPWNGHAAAALGVRYMPTVVPAWIDMQPDSDFLVNLRRPLPADLPHHLFFGYDTGRSVTMLFSHDTVVSLETQLATWAQDQATRTYGFHRDHMTILDTPEPAERFYALLDRTIGD